MTNWSITGACPDQTPMPTTTTSSAPFASVTPPDLREAQVPVVATRIRRKEARPSELLEAALKLFISKGYAATRVQEVAAAAGVSKGTLFRYYPSKQALFEAVVRQYMVSLIELGHAQLDARTESSSMLLKEALLKWWHLICHEQMGGLPRLVVSESENFPYLARFYIREVVQPGLQLIVKVLQRGIDHGEFRPMNLVMTAQSLWAGMSYLMLWEQVFSPHSPQTQMDAQAFIEHHVQTLCHGLMANPSRGLN